MSFERKHNLHWGLLCVPTLVLCGVAYWPNRSHWAGLLAQTKADVSHSSGTVQSALSGHQRMLKLLEEIRERAKDDNPAWGEGNARRLRAELAALGEESEDSSGFTGVTRWQLYFELGEAELSLGNELEAIDKLSKAYRLLPKVKSFVKPELPMMMTFRLGVAYMRLGETQNCCLQGTAESCILPIRKGGIHNQQQGSKEAINYFTEVLNNTDELSSVHLEARWLLNIAYMTINGYPRSVPKEHLIPPAAFESEEEFPRFINIAPRLGLNMFNQAGGACVDDFNNDGYLDLVVSTMDTSGQIRLLLNNRDGTFSDRTKEAGLEGIFGGLNLVQADYDNDGNVDILVLRGGWFGDKGRHPKSLLRNNGDGTFTDVTFEAGLGKVHYPTQTAAWGDFDNDGDLDLFVGNEASYQGAYLPQQFASAAQRGRRLDYPCELFRNNGDGTFSDVAKEAGVTNDRWTKAVVWGDYDGDGFPDLYLSNFTEPNRLYHNNRNGTFTDLAPQLGTTGPFYSFPCWFWDFDNDGMLDIYVSAYSSGIADLAATSLGLFFESEKARLYRGNGHGFDDVAGQVNLARPSAPMGANFGDLDNDGFLDFYLGTGYTDYKQLMPNVMYHNRGGKSFADVSAAGGFAHLQKGHGVVFADFDNDGDQDVFEQMGGAFRGDKFWDVFYENPGFGNHWIAIQLVGVKSNRSAIGARIRVDILENQQQRSIFKFVNSGGSFGANPLRQSIGLGKASEIRRLQILWPTTGKAQVLNSVPFDRFIRIVEAEGGYTTLSLRRLTLGTHDK